MNFFDQSFPFLKTRRFHLYLVFSSSLFFVLFLLIFMPFGVNEPQKEFNLFLVGVMSMFGGVILFTLLANEFLLRNRIVKQWTVKTFIGWMFWMVLTAGSMNFLLYNYLQSWYDLYWSSYFLHVLNVGAVLIFPIAGVFYYFRHMELARQLQQHHSRQFTLDLLQTPVTFSGSTERDQITLELQQFCYVESDDNYVIIHYLDGNRPKKYMMRSTLSAIEQAEYPVDFLQRIHRSFVVNIFMVETIRGNVHKSELKLRHINQFFPVSRTYVHQVRQRMEEDF